MKRCIKNNGKIFISETDYASRTWFSPSIDTERQTLEILDTKLNNVLASRKIPEYVYKSDMRIIDKEVFEFQIKEFQVAEKIFKITNFLANHNSELERITNEKYFTLTFNMINYTIVK